MDFFVGGTEAEKNGSNSRSLCGELWVEINRTYAIESKMIERINIFIIYISGLVMVEQGDDQLMHFKWKDRSSGNIEDDLIIFPDDVEFKKVPQCNIKS